MSAKVEQIFLKIQRGRPMRPVSEAVARTGRGLVGDLGYGSRKRQVLLMDRETLDEFELSPGDVRENLTSRGLDLSSLQAGAEIRIGEVVLQITGNCAPCDQMETLRTGLRQAIDGRRGVLATVLKGGTLRIGDSILAQSRDTSVTRASESPLR